jgi:hypothetical protein
VKNGAVVGGLLDPLAVEVSPFPYFHRLWYRAPGISAMLPLDTELASSRASLSLIEEQ